MSLHSCLSGVEAGPPLLMALATAAGIVLTMAWLPRQTGVCGRPFLVLALAAMLWWLLAATGELAAPTLACKVVFGQLAWPGISLAPVAWALFLWHYCFGLSPPRWRAAAAAFIAIVVPVTLAAATNPLHQLFYGPDTRLGVVGGQTVAVFAHGPLFHASAALLYLPTLTALALTVLAGFRAPPGQRPHLLMLALGTLVPTIANLSHLLFGLTLFGYDPTPFAFAFMLLALAIAIYANRMFDIGLAARDLLWFNHPDPALVLDAGMRVVARNPAAEARFPELGPGAKLADHPALAAIAGRVWDGIAADGAEVAAAGRLFAPRLLGLPHPLGGASGRLGGLLVLADVTAARESARRLEAALAASRWQLAELDRLRAEAELLARSDPLTELGNRRALEASFAALVAAPGARRRGIALALLDIDRFKSINDRFGHAVGDRVIRDVARIVAAACGSARPFRIGGEEFVLLAPGRRAVEALALVERLRARLARTPLLREADEAFVTFSAGIACWPSEADALDALLALADARLYAAKSAGRDRTVWSDARLLEVSDEGGGLRRGRRAGAAAGDQPPRTPAT